MQLTGIKQKTAELAWYQIDDFTGDPDSGRSIPGNPDAASYSDYAQDANRIYYDSGSHTVGDVAFSPDTGSINGKSAGLIVR